MLLTHWADNNLYILTRPITPSKVIQGHRGRYQSIARMRLPISDWHPPISYRFGVIAAYYSNFGHCVFEPSPWGVTDNVRCSSWAHWKACISF